MTNVQLMCSCGNDYWITPTKKIFFQFNSMFIWRQMVWKYLHCRLCICRLQNEQHSSEWRSLNYKIIIFSEDGSIHFPYMMTSSNGKIVRFIGHLCREFTGDRWTPSTKASDAELWCFLWSECSYITVFIHNSATNYKRNESRTNGTSRNVYSLFLHTFILSYSWNQIAVCIHLIKWIFNERLFRHILKNT